MSRRDPLKLTGLLTVDQLSPDRPSGNSEEPAAYQQTGTWLQSTLAGWDGGSGRYEPTAGYG